MGESIFIWCDSNSILTILKLHSHITILWRVWRLSEISDFWFFLYIFFWLYKIQMHMDLFFDHYFNFLSAKTKTNKKLLNLINLDGLKSFERQKYDTWIAMCLNHFENDVISRAFQLFLKRHFHVTGLWRFCRISEILEFSFLSVDLKTKTRKSWKISIFGSRKFKCIWIYLLVTILTFWVLKLK